MISSVSAFTRVAERAPAPSSVPPATGYESRRDADEAGWLGQTPPPSPPGPSSCPHDEPQAPQYANPHLAPEPWKDNGSLWGNDPTLFG